MVERTRSIEDGYHDEFGIGRSLVGGDAMFYTGTGPRGPVDASVDGQSGTIRGKDVFTIEEAAYYLNRGDGVINYQGGSYNSGANWDGAQGTANNQWYWLPVSKTNGGDAAFPSVGGAGANGPLTTLNFGFYESVATLPDPYVYTRASDGTNAKYVGFGVVNGFSAFSEAQREATRQAIESWDDLIAVSFKETHHTQGDLNFMNTTTGPAQASAYLPYDYGTTGIIQDDGSEVTYAEIAGDVYVNPNQASNQQFDEGQYGLTTLIHEIGHALGLEHPGAYNFGPGFDLTYEGAAEYYQDSAQYSIMSYWDAEETGAQRVNWELLTYNYSSTPSVHDVAAIQRIYGADMTTRTGNNVYGFNTTEKANGSFDFANSMFPVVTIWDAGGNDTLDLSGFKTPSVIDLNPGAFTSAGGFFSEEIPTLAEINARRAEAGLAPRTQAQYNLYLDLFAANYTNGLLTDNIAIAYGAWIENAVGGIGNDTITGNVRDNVLDGGAGNDVLMGGAGKDTLNGGTGFDTASWANATSGVKVSVGNDFSGDSGEGDKFTSIEKIEGSNFNDELKGGNSADTLFGLGGNDTISGGNAADTLDGGAGNDFIEGGNDIDSLSGGDGADTLDGGNGDDLLNGGAGDDSLRGGNGIDTYVFDANSGTDTIQGLSRSDRIDLSAFGTDDQVGVDTSQAGKIFVDAGNDGTVDLTILYTGSRPTAAMFEYADAGAAGGATSAMQTEYLVAA